MSWQLTSLFQLTNITLTQIFDTLTSRWRQTLWDRCFMVESSGFNREHIQRQQLLFFWDFWQVCLHSKHDNEMKQTGPCRWFISCFTSWSQADVQQIFVQNKYLDLCTSVEPFKNKLNTLCLNTKYLNGCVTIYKQFKCILESQQAHLVLGGVHGKGSASGPGFFSLASTLWLCRTSSETCASIGRWWTCLERKTGQAKSMFGQD